MRCPNKSHPDWKEVVRKVGINEAYNLYFKNDYEIPNPEDIRDSIKGINAGLKITSALHDMLGRVSKHNRKYEGGLATPTRQTIDISTPQKEANVRKDFERRGVPKNQIDLVLSFIREKGLNKIKTEDLLLDVVNELSYTIHTETSIDIDGNPTQDYQKLSINGGVNHTNHAIYIPGIKPSIAGHASFADPDDIGWFRADERAETFMDEDLTLSDEPAIYRMPWEGGNTRRILEFQSDLFQKGRNEKNLVTPADFQSNNGEIYKIEYVITPNLVGGVSNSSWQVYNSSGKVISVNEAPQDLKDYLKSIKESAPNSFLQLLNKGNNWVTVFIKSIIQDSARQAYDKVLFPTGNTSVKIESGTENIQSIDEAKSRNLPTLALTGEFYEGTVYNILKKQGYKPSRITDEYGNDWFEIEINRERDESEFYFQQSSEEKAEINREVNTAVKNFLEKNGISYEAVSGIRHPETGEKMSAVAVANLLTKVVQVVEGKQKADTLPEEAGHILVALLGDSHPLVRSMMSEIESYDIYQEVVNEYGEIYNNDTTKLKKEAIGKVIARKMLGLPIDRADKREARADRWWNRVLKAIKNIIASFKGRTEFETKLTQVDPFGEAAQMIMNETLVPHDEVTGEFYFQLTQDEIVTALKDKHKLSKDGQGYTVHKDGQEKKVKNRVTDRVKRFLRETFGESELTKFAEIAAEWGTRGHSDIENIIQRTIAKKNGSPVPARQVHTKEGIYNILETYFTAFVDNIPQSSKILTEVQIYDPVKNEAGTIDFLVIHSDGSASIYDWKFMKFGKMRDVKWYKKGAFEIQLNAYREILKKEYGISSFKEIRVIPVDAVYKGEELTGIKIGNSKVEEIVESVEYLRPIPSIEERTGNKALDRIIDSLVFEKKKIESTQIPTGLSQQERDEYFSSRNIRLAQIAKAIQDIQLRHDLTEFVNMGRQLNEALENSDLSEYTEAELVRMLETKLKFYGKDLIEVLSANLGDKFKDLYDDLTSIAGQASVLSAKVKNEIERRVDELNPELRKPQKEIGWWSKYFRTFFNQDNPVIAAFADLIQRSNALLKKEYDELAEKVNTARVALRKAGITNYDWMLREDPKTGQLKVASRTSKEFQDAVSEAREVLSSSASTKAEKEKARNFMLENYDFNKEQYEKDLEEHKKRLEARQKKEGFSDEMFATETARFIDKYSDNSKALSNRFNRNLKMKDKPENYSQEYKDILSSPEKKAFYDLYMEYSLKYQSYIGKEKEYNFVWNVPLALTDGIAENGLNHIVNKDAWLNYYKAQEYEYFANTDPDTGEVLLQVPKMFDRPNRIEDEDGNVTYDTRLQSRDLGQVLLTVSGMAINHKNMLDIEGNAQLLKHIMANQEIYVSDRFGKLAKDATTGELMTHVNNSSNQDALRMFMEYYLYGRKIQHKDQKFLGMSSVALLKSGMGFFRAKALALNPLSITANTVGGHLNAVMVGASNRYYRVRDFERSLWELGTANEKTHAIRKFMNIEEGENYKFRSTKQSMSILKKLLNEETAYIGQRLSDWPTKQGIMLAMMKHYRVVDGKIVNKNLAPSDAPTLFDYAEIKNDELTFKDITEEELSNFRAKVLGITDSVLGTGAQHNDVRLINTNVFGDMLMMFRSWLPRTFDSRWGELRKLNSIEEWEMGRYRSFLNNLVHGVKNDEGGYLPGILKTSRDLLLGFGTFGIGNESRNTTIEHAKVLYAEAKLKDPTLTLTEAEYVQMHLGNLRASMVELYLMIGMASLIMLAAPDEDEKMSELSGTRRFTLNALKKFQTELLTYISPSEFEALIKRPVPFIRFFTDITNLFKANTMYGLEMTGLTEEPRKKNAVRRAWFQMFPVLSGIESMMQYIEDDYNSMNKYDDKIKSSSSR